MPGNPRAIVIEAERKFPVRIVVKLPSNGFGQRYNAISDWLDENCGIAGWQFAPSGRRGMGEEAIAVYLNGPACAVAFVARWLMPGDLPGFYRVREDDPPRRVPLPAHKTP